MQHFVTGCRISFIYRRQRIAATVPRMSNAITAAELAEEPEWLAIKAGLPKLSAQTLAHIDKLGDESPTLTRASPLLDMVAITANPPCPITTRHGGRYC